MAQEKPFQGYQSFKKQGDNSFFIASTVLNRLIFLKSSVHIMRIYTSTIELVIAQPASGNNHLLWGIYQQHIVNSVLYKFIAS